MSTWTAAPLVSLQPLQPRESANLIWSLPAHTQLALLTTSMHDPRMESRRPLSPLITEVHPFGHPRMSAPWPCTRRQIFARGSFQSLLRSQPSGVFFVAFFTR